MLISVLFLILACFSQISQSSKTTYTLNGINILQNETRTLDVSKKDLEENYTNVFSSSDKFAHETDIPFFQEGDEIVIRLLYKGRFGIFLDRFNKHEKIALAISFRPHEKEVVFNTFLTETWSVEERITIEVKPPTIVGVSIQLLEHMFMIMVNNHQKIFFHRSRIAAGPMRMFFLGEVMVDEVSVEEEENNTFEQKPIKQGAYNPKFGQVPYADSGRIVSKAVKKQPAQPPKTKRLLTKGATPRTTF